MSNPLGEVSVELVAKTGKFNKDIDAAAKKFKQNANAIKEGAERIASTGAIFTAMGAAIVRQASQYDRGVKQQVDKMSNAFNTMAVEIGRTLLPVVSALSSAFSSLASWFRGLGDGARTAIAAFAGLIILGTTLAGTVSKIAGLSTVFKPMVAFISPLLPVIAAVAAAIAGLVLVASLVRVAWEENWGGIQEKTREVVDWMKTKWTEFKELFTGSGGVIVTSFTSIMDKVLKHYTSTIATMLEWVAKLAAKVPGLSGVSDFASNLAATFRDIGERGTSGLLQDLKDGGGAIVDSAKIAADKLVKGGKLLAADIKGALGSGKGLPRLMSISDQDKMIADAKKRGENSRYTDGDPVADALFWKNREMDEFTSQWGVNLGGSWVPGPQGPLPPSLRDDEERADRRNEVAREEEAKAKNRTSPRDEAVSAMGKDIVGGLDSGVGGIASGVSQGAAIGGPIGAMVGAIMAVVTKAKPFIDMVTSIGDVLVTIANIATAFLAPFTDLFTMFGRMLTPLVPVISQFVQVVNVMFLPLRAALPILFYSMKGFGIAVLWVAKQIASVWDWMIGALQTVLSGLKSVLPDKPLDGLIKWLEDIKSKTDYGQQLRDLNAMGMNDPAPSAEDGLVPPGGGPLPVEDKPVADAIDDLAQAITNVPAGYKIDQTRWEAMNAGNDNIGSAAPTQEYGSYSSYQDYLNALSAEVDGGPHALPPSPQQQQQWGEKSAMSGGSSTQFASGGLVTRTTNAIIGEAGPEAVIPLDRLVEVAGAVAGASGGGGSAGTVNVYITSNDPDVVWRKLEPYLRRRALVRTGTVAGL